MYHKKMLALTFDIILIFEKVAPVRVSFSCNNNNNNKKPLPGRAYLVIRRKVILSVCGQNTSLSEAQVFEGIFLNREAKTLNKDLS
jgi:hypothetical protein